MNGNPSFLQDVRKSGFRETEAFLPQLRAEPCTPSSPKAMPTIRCLPATLSGQNWWGRRVGEPVTLGRSGGQLRAGRRGHCGQRPTLSEEDSQSLEVIQAGSQAGALSPSLPRGRGQSRPSPCPLRLPAGPSALAALGTGSGVREGRRLAGGGPWTALGIKILGSLIRRRLPAPGGRTQGPEPQGLLLPGDPPGSGQVGPSGTARPEGGCRSPDAEPAGVVTPLPGTPGHMCSPVVTVAPLSSGPEVSLGVSTLSPQGEAVEPPPATRILPSGHPLGPDGAGRDLGGGRGR